MKAFWALYRAAALQFLRDRMAILFTLLLPLLMVGFFGLIFDGQPDRPGQIPQAQLYVPGMLALGVLWLGVFGAAPPLVQLRERQVLRRLGATPLKRSTLLAAQVAFRVTTGLVQAAVMILYGLAAYRVAVTGSWLLLPPVVVLGCLLFVSIGFLIAGLAKSTDSAIAIGQAVQFPMMFLSGILVPPAMLPDFLRPVSAAMPLTYLGDALSQVMLGSPPLYPLWVDLAVLTGVLLLCTGLAVRTFRWE